MTEARADNEALSAAIDRLMPFAEGLFDELAARTRDGEGVTRPAWSDRDQIGVEIMEREARALGLETESDAAGNLYVTLPGRDRSAPALLTGSHLDSVPTGGNYDGAAGAIAGLVLLAAFKELGIEPVCDVRCVGLRGEESVWYGIAYIGSRLAVGSLDPAEAEKLIRGDTDRSLFDHMRDLGLDPGAPARSPAHVTSANTKAFLELHIEQGPVLIERAVPTAVPTVIRGNVRFPYAKCYGEYAHSAAVPRSQRQDALLAAVELVGRLDARWQQVEAEDHPDTVFTVGKLFTDPGEHAMTKVPGECSFTLNFGGTSKDLLDRLRAETFDLAAEIAARRRVTFELGDCVGSDPTPLDGALRQQLTASAASLGIATTEMPTVGHDASVFARAGIPSAMVLVRNQHGSHNAAEAMEMADFGEGVKILAAAARGLVEA